MEISKSIHDLTRVEFFCEVCGRSLGPYDVMDHNRRIVLRPVKKPMALGLPTGKHRIQKVEDRDGDPTLGDVAYRFQCGCGRKPRTVGDSALRRKFERTTEPRIWV